MSKVDARQQDASATARIAAGAGACRRRRLLWAGWAWWADRSYRSAIMAIELEMANGRFGIAARELNKLLEREPGDGEAAILLGTV